MSSPSALQSLIYTSGDQPTLKVLDQLLIPAEKVYVDVPNIQTAWSVIRSMQIRGAPLIAIVASLGLAVDLKSDTSRLEMEAIEQMNGLDRSGPAIMAYIQGKMDYLATSRPTAVNLFHALAEIKQALMDVQQQQQSSSESESSTRERMVNAVLKHAEFMLERDVNDNQQIGRHGANAILAKALSKEKKNTKMTVMTICNTGSLATAHYGTALGVVRALQEQDALQSVIALETRPYNQGSRLTAFEMVQEDMPGATLICDSMAAAYMANSSNNKVDAVVVGADRVCANGDTANKIGTYSLALIAAAHKVPFYVAAPLTTLDADLPHGSAINIEERPPAELIESSRAPPTVNVWNPAFDVTPASYITGGIITEKGIIEPTPDGRLPVKEFLAATEPSSSKLVIPADYIEQTVDSLPLYLSQHAPEAMTLLGLAAKDQASSATDNADDIECVEMGDGNLNLVFIVTNKKDRSKQLIVKQALPYVRVVGESWPLTLERSYYEYKALMAEKQACPEFVPTVYHFAKQHGLMVMQYLASPNIILRKGLIQGLRYPTMAADMGTFCAKTLFSTSGFSLTPTELRQQVQFWSTNVEMCALTEQVVFTEPYINAPNNRWTSPQLDNDKKAIEQDETLKLAAAKYKTKFITQTQALIHGDLHSGSVMCSPVAGQTFVIDPEFAFYGPMGFDTGAFVANLFLAYVSQPGHDNDNDYGEWILQQIETFWMTFAHVFIKQWNDPKQHTGFCCGRDVFGDNESESTSLSRSAAQEGFLSFLLADTLGFAGMKMLRRVVGIAHVEDLESIADPNVRATCEQHALRIAKEFIVQANSFPTIQAATQRARELSQKLE